MTFIPNHARSSCSVYSISLKSLSAARQYSMHQRAKLPLVQPIGSFLPHSIRYKRYPDLLLKSIFCPVHRFRCDPVSYTRKEETDGQQDKQEYFFHTDILLDRLFSGGKGTHFYNQDNPFNYSIYHKNRFVAVNLICF